MSTRRQLDTIERGHTTRTLLIESMNQLNEAYAKVFETAAASVKAIVVPKLDIPSQSEGH